MFVGGGGLPSDRQRWGDRQRWDGRGGGGGIGSGRGGGDRRRQRGDGGRGDRFSGEGGSAAAGGVIGAGGRKDTATAMGARGCPK